MMQKNMIHHDTLSINMKLASCYKVSKKNIWVKKMYEYYPISQNRSISTHSNASVARSYEVPDDEFIIGSVKQKELKK